MSLKIVVCLRVCGAHYVRTFRPICPADHIDPSLITTYLPCVSGITIYQYLLGLSVPYFTFENNRIRGFCSLLYQKFIRFFKNICPSGELGKWFLLFFTDKKSKKHKCFHPQKVLHNVIFFRKCEQSYTRCYLKLLRL